MSLFRSTLDYTELQHKFDLALDAVWPKCYIDDKCELVDSSTEHLEELMLSSFRLMKHIRIWLKKKKIDYSEANSFPSLNTALERVTIVFMQQKTGNLNNEASALEAVSRACFRLLRKENVIKIRPRNRPDEVFPEFWCWQCQNSAAMENGLCHECSNSDPSVSTTPFESMGSSLSSRSMIANDMMFSNRRV